MNWIAVYVGRLLLHLTKVLCWSNLQSNTKRYFNSIFVLFYFINCIYLNVSFISLFLLQNSSKIFNIDLSQNLESFRQIFFLILKTRITQYWLLISRRSITPCLCNTYVNCIINLFPISYTKKKLISREPNLTVLINR